jgi:hypothetical protein
MDELYTLVTDTISDKINSINSADPTQVTHE